MAELAQRFEVHPHEITAWERQLGEQSVEVFENGRLPRNSKSLKASGASKEGDYPSLIICFNLL